MFIFKLLRSFGHFSRDLILGDQTVIQALGSSKAKIAMGILLAGFALFNTVILGHISALRQNYAVLSREYLALNAKYEAACGMLPATPVVVASLPKPPVEVKVVEKPKVVEAPVVVVAVPPPVSPPEVKKVVAVITPPVITPSKKVMPKSDDAEKRYLELKRQYDKIKAREEKTD